MNKVELVRSIVEVSTEEVSQKQVTAMLAALETVTREEIKKDGEVTIPGIGKVKTKIVPERTGTVMMGANKGEKWVKPEHKEATIKIASSLKKIFE